MREENLLARVRVAGEDLREVMAERFGRHRHVGDVRGCGLLMALEVVADRATQAAFEAG